MHLSSCTKALIDTLHLLHLEAWLLNLLAWLLYEAWLSLHLEAMLLHLLAWLLHWIDHIDRLCLIELKHLILKSVTRAWSVLS